MGNLRVDPDSKKISHGWARTFTNVNKTFFSTFRLVLLTTNLLITC